MRIIFNKTLKNISLGLCQGKNLPILKNKGSIMSHIPHDFAMIATFLPPINHPLILREVNKWLGGGGCFNPKKG